MRFSNPNALWYLLLIPIVILMYILKQNYEQKEMPSNFLWDIVSKEDEVTSPWQKLKKNILMLLQILAIVFITIALANPYIYKEKETNNVQIIVIDTSGSMNAKYSEGQTRLDYAKDIAKKRVNKLLDGTPVTIISIGDNLNIEISNETNKESIKKSINKIKQSYGSQKISDNISFVYSIANTYENHEIVILSDEIIEDINAKTYLVNSVGINVSVDYLSTYFSEGKYEALAKVSNRYLKPVDIHLNLYDENDNLIKSREIHLEANESSSILFDNIIYDGDFIYSEIKEKDLIIEDNTRYCVLSKNKTKKVLLVSEGNIFIEKAILASNRYELYKTNKTDIINEKYDLYIFDSMLPDILPAKGNYLFINLPKVEGFYDTKVKDNSGLVNFKDTSITNHIKDEIFIVSSYNKIMPNEHMESIATLGDDIIISKGNIEGQKFGVLSFDIHNSDFPLNVSFPVLIDSLLLNILGNNMELSNSYSVGESISFEPYSTTKEGFVINPNNNKDILDIQYPITYYDNTKDIGVYKLNQINDEDKEKINFLAVNYNTRLESTINEFDAVDNDVIINNTNNSDRKIDSKNLFIIIALIIVLYEWKRYVLD